MNSTNKVVNKPIPLRVIFILNALMMVLPFVFYMVVTSKNIHINGLNPSYMLYTGAAYIVSFIALVRFILNRNIIGVRSIVFLNVLIALPTKAYIAIIVAIISMLLSFNRKVKAYFMT